MGDNQQEKGDEVMVKRCYWLCSTGEKGRLWEEFKKDGVIRIGWDEIGDLSLYGSREDIIRAMERVWFKRNTSQKVNSEAAWQFANEVAVGDIVYAKRGLNLIVGYGVVESGYIFDNTLTEFKHLHKVNWTTVGEFKTPFQLPMKVLTEISDKRYAEKLEKMFAGE
jgi:5-methylcytosine-specific restriction protein B